MKRRIGVVTGSRADFGLLQWILRDIDASSDLELLLFVTGAHLSEEFGRTVDEIRREGFQPIASVPSLAGGDDSLAVARSIALGVSGLGQAMARDRPDILLLMADRYEIFAAATAAVALGIPIAHFSGGESTEGLFDDQLRHAISKMSHLHFPSMDFYRSRLLRMGEQPERVFAVGEPGLDHCRRTQLLEREALSDALGLDLSKPSALVTFHPVTLELDSTAGYVAELLRALDEEELADLQLLMTYPGADPSARVIVGAFEAFATHRPGAVLFKNLGTQRYLSALRHASVMIGNSSSGLVEAPSFGLPVVNVGNRQRGRVRAANVIDVECRSEAIVAGVRRALEPPFREALRGLANPYGDGRTAERVLGALRSVDLASLRYKPFFDEPDRAK